MSGYLAAEAGRLPPASMFRAAGRAYPDLSGIAHNYLVVTGTTLSTNRKRPRCLGIMRK